MTTLLVIAGAATQSMGGCGRGPTSRHPPQGKRGRRHGAEDDESRQGRRQPSGDQRRAHRAGGAAGSAANAQVLARHRARAAPSAGRIARAVGLRRGRGVPGDRAGAPNCCAPRRSPSNGRASHRLFRDAADAPGQQRVARRPSCRRRDRHGAARAQRCRIRGARAMSHPTTRRLGDRRGWPRLVPGLGSAGAVVPIIGARASASAVAVAGTRRARPRGRRTTRRRGSPRPRSSCNAGREVAAATPARHRRRGDSRLTDIAPQSISASGQAEAAHTTAET